METEVDANGKNYYEQESFADESTTFEELEIGASSFGVYSQDGTLIQSYNTIDTDTLGDFLTILRDEGFNANIDNGEITIKSTNDKYIAGDLADKLGISTKETNYVASTEQSFNNQVPVTTESTTIITEMTTTTTSTTNTVTIPVTTTVETTTTRTEQTTTVTSIETVITEWTTTTTSTTSTSTIYTTATVETTTTSTTETIATVYTVTTETLLIPATAAATLAVDDGVAAASETSGFIEPVTRRDTSTMTALGSVDSTADLTDGTYKISTTEELQLLATMTNAGLVSSGDEFVLANDIDLSSIENWTPIGISRIYSFRGTFDGNGYTISNLTINTPDEGNKGLFGSVGKNFDVEIKNLALENVNILGTDSIGGLIANNSSGGTTITNCYISGVISGNDTVGGLIGNGGADISNCYVTGSIIAASNSGGIIGSTGSYSSTIKNSSVYSFSNTLNGIFIGDASSAESVKILDSNYNTYYDTINTPIMGSEAWDDNTITNVTPVEVSPPVTYTTATLDTTLGELGVTDFSFATGLRDPVLLNCDANSTVEELIQELANYDTTAELQNGVLTLASNERLLMFGFLYQLGATQTSSETTTTVTTTQTIQVEQVTETPVTETIWTTTTAETTRTETITSTQTIDVTITDTILTEQVIDTPVTETIWHTTTSETTRTETINTTSTISVTGSTLLSELGPYSSLRVTVISDSTKQFVTLDSDTSLDDFYSDLLALGVNASSSGGITTFTGQGNSYIDSDNIEDILGLSSVTRTMGTKTSNTDSEQLYAKERIYGVYAPGKVSLQAGVDSGANSQIMVDVSFSLRGINNLRGIGENLSSDYLTVLDNILAEITAKQTQFGASANRLESALEDIMIRRDNLISSRSTLRDADIANVSSQYIQQQILQQASATLMATANQSPNIALQLI